MSVYNPRTGKIVQAHGKVARGLVESYILPYPVTGQYARVWPVTYFDNRSDLIFPNELLKLLVQYIPPAERVMLPFLGDLFLSQPEVTVTRFDLQRHFELAIAQGHLSRIEFCVFYGISLQSKHIELLMSSGDARLIYWAWTTTCMTPNELAKLHSAVVRGNMPHNYMMYYREQKWTFSKNFVYETFSNDSADNLGYWMEHSVTIKLDDGSEAPIRDRRALNHLLTYALDSFATRCAIRLLQQLTFLHQPSKLGTYLREIVDEEIEAALEVCILAAAKAGDSQTITEIALRRSGTRLFERLMQLKFSPPSSQAVHNLYDLDMVRAVVPRYHKVCEGCSQIVTKYVSWFGCFPRSEGSEVDDRIRWRNGVRELMDLGVQVDDTARQLMREYAIEI